MAKLNLPDELANEIDILKQKKIFGIKSRDEFVRESVRINLERYQKMLNLKENTGD